MVPLLKDKGSPLHPVSERGDTSLVQLLLNYKANTEVKNRVRNKSQVISHAVLLTRDHANCNIFNQNEESPLHLAVKNSHIPVIHCLLTAGCNINATDKVGAPSLNRKIRHL